MTILRMKIVSAGLVAAAACIAGGCGTPAPEEPKAVETAASACEFPAAMAASNEETAWRIFVAANCAVNGQLGWETWTEQTCLADPSAPGCAATAAAGAAPVRHLHGSRLSALLQNAAPAANIESSTPGACSPLPGSPMTGTTKQPASGGLKQFVPPNITASAEFCEEVFVNTPEASFVRTPAPNATLTNLQGQAAYSATTPIDFPTAGIEIKADWLPADSLKQPFDCADNKPAGVYVESISGKCYALVGMHISSKLLPDWLWATFEPQSSVTNPNRCKPDLYDDCNDPWGSDPAVSTGQATAATSELTAPMKQAGLPEVFLNYRLTGAQSAYLDGGNPVELGNSFVEFNAGVEPHQASCMTCHSYAMVSSTGQEGSIGKPLVGTPGPPPAGTTWYTQDFSWMLATMPAGPSK